MSNSDSPPKGDLPAGSATPPAAPPPNAQAPNAQPPDGRETNAPPPNAQAPNAQAPNAQPPNAQPPGTQPPGTERLAGQSSDAPAASGHSAGGRTGGGRRGTRGEKDRAARRAQFERELRALTPEQKKSLMRVNRHVFGFGAAALATMIGLTLPLPWPALGLAAMALALVLAIKGIVLARRTPMGKGVIVYLAMGIGLLATFALYSIPLLVTWADQWEYQQCRSQALTIEGEDACLARFEEAAKSDWATILRQLRQ